MIMSTTQISSPLYNHNDKSSTQQLHNRLTQKLVLNYKFNHYHNGRYDFLCPLLDAVAEADTLLGSLQKFY